MMLRAFAVLAAILIGRAGVLLGDEAAEPPVAPPVSVHTVDFSPDGGHLAMGFGAREGAGGLLVWNLEKKAPLHVHRRDQAVTSV